jgi:hypothetical protein
MKRRRIRSESGRKHENGKENEENMRKTNTSVVSNQILMRTSEPVACVLHGWSGRETAITWSSC